MSRSSDLTLVSAVASAISDPPDNATSAPHRRASKSAAPVETPEPIRLYRLVIEPDEKTGTFIYKTVDRETGEVVRRYPREDLMRMREDPDYDAGVVADLRA